jgi:pimeloyl-ACP methyl ester carboxylesterase
MPTHTAAHPVDRTLRIAGATCALTIWESPDLADPAPDVVLVHGAAANRHWWSHIAPRLGARRVLALDLWGHGGSERRSGYVLDDWADQLIEVVRRWGVGRPYLVGQSVGGLIAVQAAQTAPEEFAGVLALDSFLRRTDPALLLRRQRTSERPLATFSSVDEAVAEFVRRHPAAAHVDDELLAEIGRQSHCRVGDLWQRAFDPRVFGRPEVADDFLRTPRVPTMWVRAERGAIDDPMADRISAGLGSGGRLVEVSGVGHQLNLEKPALCRALIEDFLAWAPTSPLAAEPGTVSACGVD